MKKVWLLAARTYRQYIRSGTFLILTFGLPLLMVIAGAVPAFSMMSSDLPRAGYVDQTGRLAVPPPVQIDEAVMSLTAFDEPNDAQTALAQGDIDGYLVIPSDYFQGHPPIFYGQEEPSPFLETALIGFMRQAMLTNQPEWVAERLAEPSQLTYVARATGEEVAEGPGLLIRIVTPMVLALVFALTVLTSAGQMGAALVQEKEQRAMEMVITSLAPWQLVVGKVLGITLLALTQIAIWAGGAGIALGLILTAAGGPSLSLPWKALLWAVLLGVPGYFLYAVLAAGLGIIAGDRQQARQLSGLLGFLGLLPLYAMGALVNALDGPLAIGLTWFPLTAPVVALFRLALAQVPTWQLLVSLIMLILSLVASVWFVARIFRTAMLMYGQSLRPQQIWRALW